MSGHDHRYISSNAFKAADAVNLEELLSGRLSDPLYLNLETPNEIIPLEATDEQRRLDLEIIARRIFKEIREDVQAHVQRGTANRIRRDVRASLDEMTDVQLARIVCHPTVTNDAQVKILVHCYLGQPISLELLQPLTRIFAGGITGACIYLILAKARTVDGKNPFIDDTSFGRDTLMRYVGSANSNDPYPGSFRIHQHGVN